MPGGSKIDPPLGKAKLISNGGSTSGITFLSRGGNCCATAVDKGMRICERNNSADTKVSEEVGGSAPDAGAEIPLQPVVKTIPVPLQPMEVQSGADTHL
ncbi:protein pxr1-like [Limosa lapponica baueri]|uniref:Protein pxr1-like n=1 Tax=Limosa lapponica baueri TaxID=1758121 RepID=A0A2I0UK46_LIMLA|nr:protein pxr1-like [Limosa lapponica baueri]